MQPYYTRRWAVEFCKAYFGLSDQDEYLIRGPAGLQYLQQRWEQEPGGHYEDPLQILRQEWFHVQTVTGWYVSPGFWQAIPRTGVVLDWGCGTAEIARLPWILPGRRYVGVEVSNACRGYFYHKYAGTKAQCIDASLLLPIGLYDAVICIDVLEHVTDPLAVQRHIWDRLKPGGHALLKFDDSFPHPGHLRESILQRPAWEAWLREHAEIVEEEVLTWVRKPH